MILYMSFTALISNLQKEFNSAYPFLKLEFYKTIESGFSRKHIKDSVSLRAAGLKLPGVFEISDIMSVGTLENSLRIKFGLQVQVSRKSGPIWLETTKTDSWTLKQQNDHGRELSEPAKAQVMS